MRVSPMRAPMKRTSLSLPLASALLAVTALHVAACEDNQTPPPEHGAYEGGSSAPLACVPNLDGKIESRELSPSVGVFATYLVSPAGKERAVDLAGAPSAGGKLVWSFAVDYADDAVLRVAAAKLRGRWYEGSFPGLPDAIVVPMDAAGTTEGVYTHDASAFLLHGIASTDPDAADKTLYRYTTPVTIYRFPLEPGAEWKSTAEVRDGTFRGLPYAGRDTYEVKVDGAGQLELPDYVLSQALRVRTKVTIEPAAGAVTSQRQVSFLFECLGEVTRVTSALNEPDENFTTASELRRLGQAP